MARGLAVLLAVLAGAGWLAAPAVAAPASPAPASPAASPAPAAGELVVSGTRTTPGELRFFLATRGLPPGFTAAKGKLTVRADTVDLPVKVEAITAEVRAAPARAVVLVIDTSGSMAGESIAAARAAALEYAGGLPADTALGLVTFADRPVTLVPPTLDRAAFQAAVGTLRAEGATALYDGVVSAAALLAGDYLERRLVVLSDGADTVSQSTAAAAADALERRHITLDLVAYGPAAASPTVAELATGAGGQLVPAVDALALKRAFRDLAGGLSAPVLVTVEVPGELSGRGVRLGLELSLDGQRVTASVPVTFDVDPGADRPRLADYRTDVLPSGLLYVAFGGIGIALLIIGFVTAHLVLGRYAVRRRLRQLEAFTADRLPNRVADAHDGGFMRAALALSDRAVRRRGLQSRIEVGLEKADIDLLPAEWMLLRAGISIGAAVVLALLLPWWLGVILGLLGGWLLTETYRRVRASRRAAKFADLLPEALHLLVGALRSGFSLAQAMDALVREGPEPVAGEFARAIAETRLGGDLEDALDGVAERTGSRDLSWLVMAVRIQREVGGNLSEVLQTAVETMRERSRLRRHVRALSAEGRLSAYVLIGMPVTLAGWLFLFRTDYVRPLFTEFMGIAMLSGAALMLVVGGIWMSKIVKVEV